MTEAESPPCPCVTGAVGKHTDLALRLAFTQDFYQMAPPACPLLTSRGLSSLPSSGTAFQSLSQAPQRVQLGEAGPPVRRGLYPQLSDEPGPPTPQLGNASVRVGPYPFQFPELWPGSCGCGSANPFCYPDRGDLGDNVIPIP